ncbi:MAG TPA: hypothetical protein VFI34_07600 [Candidatus Limnocylindrales bacterium]|nr:hypothetical protein [Candidatus Limnocylindrales bacterium]
MGKGNAKTERIGELGDMELFGPVAPERSPRVVLSAASYDQSIELFNAAKLGILGDPDHGRPGPLAHLFPEGDRVLEDRILLPGGVGRIERTTTVGGTNDGGKPSAHLFDELHEYQTEAARRLFVVGSKGIHKRRVIRKTPRELGLPEGVKLWGPLLMAISTFGASRDSLLGQLYEHGVAVAKGEIRDPGFLFLCWESDARWNLDDDEQLRQAVLEANPEAGGFLPVSSVVASVRDPVIPRSEAVRYNLARWPDAETRWMPGATWDGTKGDVSLDAAAPVFVNVAVAPDRRSAAIAEAQRDGERIRVRVSHFPEKPLAGDELLEVGELERHVTKLRKAFPARVLAPRRLRPGGSEKVLPTPGPEIVYNGAVFEGSAQRFRAEGAAVLDVPYSPRGPERLRQAGDVLISLAEQKLLVHADDPELARQIGDVVERPSASGAYLVGRAGALVVAAFATMGAVHRAMTAPRAPVMQPGSGFGSFR